MLPVTPVGAAQQLEPEWNRAVSNDLIRERVVGLLDLPELVDQGCGPAVPRRMPFHDAPSSASAVRRYAEYLVTGRASDGSQCGTARLVVRSDNGSDEELPAEESDYEILAAVVYERRGSWFRIALQQGSAWVERSDPSEFHSFPDMLQQRLSHIREGWDGSLWRVPGSGVASPVAAGWQKYLDGNVSVDVLEVRRIGNDDWLRVELRVETCGRELSGVQSTTGWIPAYRATGGPTVWYSSRGC